MENVAEILKEPSGHLSHIWDVVTVVFMFNFTLNLWFSPNSNDFSWRNTKRWFCSSAMISVDFYLINEIERKRKVGENFLSDRRAGKWEEEMGGVSGAGGQEP